MPASLPARTETTAARLLLPWVAFLALLAWAWRVGDMFHNVPAYSDGLEILWGLQWYAHNLAHGTSPLFSAAVFAPEGWQVGTLAHGPLLFLALMPLYALGGGAFTINVATLTAHVLAFGGMFKLGRLWLRPVVATAVALGFTFWSFRWFRNGAHLHTLFASALLPLQVWAWEQARRQPAQRVRWFALTGLFWGLGITASLYALWQGLVVVLVWGLAQCLGRQLAFKHFARGLLLAGATALLVSLPTLFLFWLALGGGRTAFNSIDALVLFSASLNTFSIPDIVHPWLTGLARLLNHGPLIESELANFGLFGFLTALAGFVLVRRDRRFWPLLASALVGLVLALGPVLKFNGHIVTFDNLQPLNAAIWSLGHQLKPGLFPQSAIPQFYAGTLPLPDMLFALTVPFWEGARVSARFAFVAAMGLLPLAGLAIQRLRPVWLRAALGLVLLFEIVPPPAQGMPAQPPIHPAFAWLAAQDPAGQNVIDLAANQPNRLALQLDGNVIFATLYHLHNTVSGVGSYGPAHFVFLQDWFSHSQHPLSNPDFAALMRYYGVRYLLVHMRSNLEPPLVTDAKTNAELGPAQCFAPPPGPSPWSEPVCVIEVLLPPNPHFNLIRRDGWSADEPWGTWLNGPQATADWVATNTAAPSLAVALLPVCLPHRPQHVTLTVNGVAIADHTWSDCDAWVANLSVPASLMRIGWNHLAIQADVFGQPVDTATGQTIDTRQLSVAVTQLILTPPAAPH